MHLSPGGDHTSAPERTTRIDPREVPQHIPPDGHPSSASEKALLYLPPKGHPSSATRRTPFICHQKDTLLRAQEGHFAEAVVS